MKKLFFVLFAFSLFSCFDTGKKFVGVWSDPRYAGNDKDVIVISSVGGGNYLVERRVKISAGLYVVNTDGSFKEIATKNGSNLELKTRFGSIPLSIINNNLLFESREYIKTSDHGFNNVDNGEKGKDTSENQIAILDSKQDISVSLQVIFIAIVLLVIAVFLFYYKKGLRSSILSVSTQSPQNSFDLIALFRESLKSIIAIMAFVIIGFCVWNFFLKATPISDAKKAVNNFCKCEELNTQRIISTKTKFLKAFSDSNFKSRNEANLRLQELLVNNEEYYDCQSKALNERANLKSKYLADEKSLELFEKTYQTMNSNCFNSNQLTLNKLDKQVAEKIGGILESESMEDHNGNIESDSYSYKGFIGTYPVHFRFKSNGVYDCPRGGSTFEGYYYYEKKGPLDKLLLDGYNCGASIYFTEYNNSGNTTGNFVGVWDGDKIEGRWSNDTKELEFKLMSQE